MLAAWLGWTWWQRSQGRSHEDPAMDDALAPLSPDPSH
jgi:hypothetical protein